MEFRLPDLGEGLHEGEIVEWRVEQGQDIAEDAPLVEVMTDKATVEITSPVSGKVTELCAAAGDMVPVGKVIAVITEGDGGEAPAAPAAEKPAAEKPAKSAPAQPAPAATSAAPARSAPSAAPSGSSDGHSGAARKVLAAPAVRRRAREAGIDLASVPATGPNGRVTRQDLSRYLEGAPAAAPAAPAAAASAPSAPKPAAKVAMAPGEVEVIPIRGIRRKIFEAMHRSKSRAAHFCYVEEVDVTELVALRKRLKPKAAERGVKLTYLPFIFKAIAATMPDFPKFNANIDDDKNELRVYSDMNFGMAVDGPDGLVVPVIQNVRGRSMFDLCGEIMRLAEAVRSRKLRMEDLRGGTFTVTSAGSIGGLFATPIINYPEVAILGVHKIVKRPMVMDDDSIAVRSIMYLSMSLDHRIIDGADAARFMNRVVALLEDPELLFFESL